MTELTLNDLNKIANQFLEKNFNHKIDVPIVLNKKIKRTLGRFVSHKENNKYIPLRIEMNSTFVECGKKENIIDVLKHELIHYTLCKQGKPYHDKDYIFQKTCLDLNVGLTKTYHIKDCVSRHLYECGEGCRIQRLRKINKNIYRCAKHKENLKYKGLVYP